KAQLGGTTGDFDQVVLAHLFLDKPTQHHARLVQVVRRQVQVVEKKHYGATAVERQRNAFPACRRSQSARGGQLRFFIATARHNAIKEREGAGLAVDLQHELITLQAVDKSPLLIKDHEIGLDQFSVDAHDVFCLSRTLGVGDRYRSGAGCRQQKDAS